MTMNEMHEKTREYTKDGMIVKETIEISNRGYRKTIDDLLHTTQNRTVTNDKVWKLLKEKADRVVIEKTEMTHI